MGGTEQERLPRALKLNRGQVFSGFIVKVTAVSSKYHDGTDPVLVLGDLEGEHSLYCGAKTLREFVEVEQPQPGDMLSIRFDGETVFAAGRSRKEYTLQLVRASQP